MIPGVTDFSIFSSVSFGDPMPPHTAVYTLAPVMLGRNLVGVIGPAEIISELIQPILILQTLAMGQRVYLGLGGCRNETLIFFEAGSYYVA
jgi:hypothetical protein